MCQWLVTMVGGIMTPTLGCAQPHPQNWWAYFPAWYREFCRCDKVNGPPEGDKVKGPSEITLGLSKWTQSNPKIP